MLTSASTTLPRLWTVLCAVFAVGIAGCGTLGQTVNTDAPATEHVVAHPPPPPAAVETTPPAKVDPEGLAAHAFEEEPPRERYTFLSDTFKAGSIVGEDSRALLTWENAGILSTAGGVAYLLHETVDDEVEDSVEKHHARWGKGSELLSHGGDALYVHTPLLTGIYAWGLYTQEPKFHDFSLSLVSAYKFTALGTLGLQFATHTRQDDNSLFADRGFPSAPTATSFTMAAVVDEYYGPQIGVPLYVLSGLIGWSEIDQHQHSLSDVMFGSVFGYVIGKSIGGVHKGTPGEFRILPITVSGATGVAMERRF